MQAPHLVLAIAGAGLQRRKATKLAAFHNFYRFQRINGESSSEL
jgi:hypothetical protein